MSDDAGAGVRGKALVPVSICIPVRNEASAIGDCLQTVSGFSDDVVVVDSESTDGTRLIAEQHGARVVDFRWNGVFPKKRNWALRNASFKYPWVLFLDADERPTATFFEELRRTLPNTSHVGFWIRFTNYFRGRPLIHGDVFRKLSLFRSDAGEYERFPEEWWSALDMEIHEHPVLRGTVGEIRCPIDHRDERGLHHYLAKHNEYSTWEARRHRWLRATGPEAWAALTPRQQFKYRHMGKRWFAWLYFLVSVVGKRGFLDGSAGWDFARLKRMYFETIRLKILEQESHGSGHH